MIVVIYMKMTKILKFAERRNYYSNTLKTKFTKIHLRIQLIQLLKLNVTEFKVWVNNKLKNCTNGNIAIFFSFISLLPVLLFKANLEKVIL